MYLQGYGPGMIKKWEKVISKDEKGPKASHLTPVLDFNNDGVDELFWGERLISLEDGCEVICYDKENYNGHSDTIIPFIDYKTGESYLYTCREDPTDEPAPRIVTYHADGRRAWTAFDDACSGHMHYGWLATVGKPGNIKRIAMAMKYDRSFGENSVVYGENEEFYFDAVTGEKIEFKIPCKGSLVFPIDINGDGFSEFFCFEGEYKGYIFDQEGRKIAQINDDFEEGEGAQIKNGFILKEYKCEQLMIACKDGFIRIYGDKKAKGSDIFDFRHSYKGYHDHAQTLTSSEYNHLYANLTCGI